MDTFTKPIEGAPTEPLPGADVLIGMNGNAFAIMGEVARILKRAGASRAYIDAYRTQAMSGDYDNLLAVSYHFLEDE